MAECQISNVLDKDVNTQEVNLNAITKPFDPTDHELDSDFRLTNYFDWNRYVNNSTVTFGISKYFTLTLLCRPKRVLELKKGDLPNECVMTRLRRFSENQLIQCNRQTYPIIDDPYLMGRIACAHLLAPIYAIGLSEVDSVLASVNVPNEMSDREIDAVVPLLMRGMQDCAQEADCNLLNNGSITLNAWFSIGGCVSVVCKPIDCLRLEICQMTSNLIQF